MTKFVDYIQTIDKHTHITKSIYLRKMGETFYLYIIQ